MSVYILFFYSTSAYALCVGLRTDDILYLFIIVKYFKQDTRGGMYTFQWLHSRFRHAEHCYSSRAYDYFWTNLCTPCHIEEKYL